MSESNSSTDTSYPNPTSPQFASEGDIQSFTLPSTETNLIISQSISIIDNSACQTISPLIMGNYNPVPDSQLGIVPVTTSLENNNNTNILTDVTIPDNKNENESSESEGSFHSFDGDNADNNHSSSNNTSENLPSISNLSQAQHYESGNTDIYDKNSTDSPLIPTGIDINPSVNTSGTLIVLDTPNDTDICNNTNDIIEDVAKQATEPISNNDDLSIQNNSDQSTTDNQSQSKSDPNFQTQSTLPELVDETRIPTSTSEISQIENRLENNVLDSTDGFINLDYLLMENSGSKTQIKESNLVDNVLFAEFDPLIAEQIQSQKHTTLSTEEQVTTSQSVQEDAPIDETQEEIQPPLNTKSNNYSELSYAQHETAPGLSETSNITGNLSQASTDYNEIESITDSTIVDSSNCTDSNNNSADIPKIHLSSEQQQLYPSNNNNSNNFNDNNNNDYDRYYNDDNQQQQNNHTDMPNSEHNSQQHTLPALSYSQLSDQARNNLGLDSIISTYSSNNPFYTDLIEQNMQGSNPQIEIQPPPLLFNSTNQQSNHEINLTNDASSFPESTPFNKDDMDYDDEDSSKFTEGMPLTANQTTSNYSNPSRSEFGNSEYCDDNKLSNNTNLKGNIHSIIIKGCQPGVSTQSIEDYCLSLLGDSIHSIRSSIDKKLRGPYRLLYINVLGIENVEQLAQRLQDDGIIKYPHEILKVHYDTYASVIASINRRRARANHHSTGTGTMYPSRSISSKYYQGDHYIEPNNYQQQFEPNNSQQQFEPNNYQQQFEPNNYQQQYNEYNDNGLQMTASDCYGSETRNNSDKTTALPRGEFVLCLEKVPPPIDDAVLLDYFADYVNYTVRWDSWTTQDGYLIVHVVFSDLDAARHAVDNLPARPLNGVNILISIIPSQTTATEASNMHNTENIVDSNNANKIATSGEDWVKMVIGPLPTGLDTDSLWNSVLVNFQSHIIYYKDTLIGNLPFIVVTLNDPYASFDVQRKLSDFNGELNVKIDECPPPTTTAPASDIPTTVNDTYSVNMNCNTVSVNNIYMPTKGKELFPIFKNYGKIISGIFVVPDHSNSKLGQCLVKFSNPTEAIYARDKLNGFNYRGCNFVVRLLSEIGCEEDDSSLLETLGHTQSPPKQYIADKDEMKMYTKKLSSDLFTFIKMTYLQTIEVFNKNQGHFTYESNSGVCVVKAATEDNLQRFIDTILSKVSELNLQLDADDFDRLMNAEEDSGSPMKQILLLKEAKQIEIIYLNQMNVVHIFGEIKSVETAKRVFQKFLYLQIPLTSPKVIFFSKFQSLLCEAPSLFDINDCGILFRGDDPESCKDLRAKMKEVVQNCVCISIDYFPIRLFKSATNFIQLNTFQVCLLAKFSDNNKFTEEIPKASQKATTHLCGMQTTVDHVIKLLNKPIEKLVLLCRTTLRSLTESNQQSNLLPHVTSLESQYSVCFAKIDSNKQSGLLVRGYSKEDIDAVCEELLKLFSDASIQFNKLINSGNDKEIRMQEIYIVQGNKNNHEGTKQFIKKIELDFQIKFESKGNQGCMVLSGDQDSLSKIEVNPNGLFEYLNQHIPFFKLKNKVVETQYLNSFKQLIFNYLQYLTRQFNKHILYDILDKILDTREGYSQIILDIVLLAEDKNFIDDKLREIKCTTELVQLKSSDMNLIHNAKSNFEGIAKTDFCMFEINVEKSGLLTHSLGITTHSLNDLINSAIGDLNDKRIYYIQNPSWAFYFKAKNMLKQCQDSFNCKFDMYEKKDINIEKTKTCIDIEGRRKEINDAYDKLQNWNAQFTCKNVNLRIKSFEFDSFSREVSQVKTNVEHKHSSVIIDIQDVQIKLPQCQQRPINPVVIKVLSLNDEEAEKLATFLSGCLSYVQAEPIILTRDQYQKLKFALDNGIICQKGEYYHLHFERTSDNTQRLILFAMEYFANEAMKKGTALLQPYLELHREEYRPSNSYIACHLLHNKECIESFNQMALRNDVSIQAKNNYSEPYILVGAKEKVLKQLNEMESYENSLKQTFIKENIDIQFPISCLLNDSEFSTISKTIAHPDVNVQMIIPQLSRQIELQGGTIIATYEIILAIQKVIIEIRKGDITKLQVDAIVNAANDQLKHGGGVALAISEAGGPHIQLESDAYISKFGPIPVGSCVQLSPGNLKCNRIIHAVGPQWDSNNAQEVTNQLSRCVANICSLASHVGMSVVAIPTISAGIFAFPQDICCRTIIHSLATFFNTNSHSSLSRVILVDINDDILAGLKSECDKQLLYQNLNLQVQPNPISAPAAKVRKIASSLINSVFNKIPHLPVQDDKIVKFEWQENDLTWKLYNPNSTIALQNAYKANPNGIALTTRSEFTYTVNFSSCIQTNDQTGVQRRIRIVNSTVDPQPSVLTGTQMQQTQLSRAPALTQNMVVEPPIDLSNPQWSQIDKEQICLYGHKDRLQHAKSVLNGLVESRMRTKEHELTDISKQCLHKMLSSLKERYSFLKICVKINDAPDTYTIQLEGYYKFVKDASNDMQLKYRDILLQERKVNSDLPKHWKPHKGNLCIEQINQATPEYQEVANNFHKSCKRVILKVERIQNIWLWTRYMQDKERMGRKCSAGANEIRVFHGTSNNPPEKIYNGEKGFDARFCYGMWGTASYFAVNAQYSDSGYAYQLKDGSRQIFMVCLCAGDFIEMEPDSNLRKPPLKSQSSVQNLVGVLNFTDVYYDTVAGFTNGSRVYMLYENGRAYPEYLITYR